MLKVSAVTIILASGGVLALCACAIYLQVIFVTTPFRNRNIGDIPNLSYQEVTLTAADGIAISGWYIRGTRPAGIVIVHGIHANRADLIPQAKILAGAGYHLMLIDLRGHGRSDAAILTYGYREALDVQSGVDYLLNLPEVERVGALGHSLGAAAVVRAAASNPRIEAIVVQSTYSSLLRAVDDTFNNYVIFPKWPFAPLIVALAEHRARVDISQVDSARDLARMPARPVMIIHGDGDTLFKLHHASELYASAQEPKELWIIRAAGHTNPIRGQEVEYGERVLNFFDKALGGGRG